MDAMPPKNADVYCSELSEETVVFVISSQKAHCLNEPASVILKACDGETRIADLARQIEEKYDLLPGQGEPVVAETLDKFQDLGLLRNDLSRRKFVAGTAAAVSLAVILSMAAPLPAAAASGVLQTITVSSFTIIP
jgi:hypothetical protein